MEKIICDSEAYNIEVIRLIIFLAGNRNVWKKPKTIFEIDGFNLLILVYSTGDTKIN